MCYLLPSLKRKAVRVLFPNSSWLHAYTLRMFTVFLHIGVTHRHLSDHMSDMVENTLNDLEQSKVQYECQLIIDTELSTLLTPKSDYVVTSHCHSKTLCHLANML